MKIATTPAARKRQFVTLPTMPELELDLAVRHILRRVNVSHSLARTIAVLAQLGAQR
jgi:hypothetical protein